MKRKLAGLFTALMVLSVGMTAFAAGSVSAEDIASAEKVSIESEDKNVTVEVPKDAEKVEEAKAEAKKASADSEVLAVVEIHYEGEVPEGGVSLTLKFDGIKAGENIVLLHWDSVKGVWETITPSSVTDGAVTATFTSFSPVAIVKLPEKAEEPTTPEEPEQPSQPNQPNQPNQPSTPNGPGTTQTPNGPGTTQTPNNGPGTTPTPEGKSPKTGMETSVLPILAVICAAGAVVCGKKVKANA